MRFMPKNASRWLSRIAAIAAIVVIGGCQTATFPDPNAVPIESMTIVQRQILLKATSDDLVERQTQGRLPEALTQKLISLRARELAPGLDKVKYAPSEAWRYGEFFVAAKMWKEAKAAPPDRLPRIWPRYRSEERRVGKECRSRWSPYH